MAPKYTTERKLEVLTVALVSGDEAAAAQFGVPKRTVNGWRNDPALLAALPPQALDPLAAKLRALTDRAIERATEKLDDPAARLGEMASLLRVAHDGARIASGEATRRTEAHVTGTFTLDLGDDVRSWAEEFARVNNYASVGEFVAWLLAETRRTLLLPRDEFLRENAQLMAEISAPAPVPVEDWQARHDGGMAGLLAEPVDEAQRRHDDRMSELLARARAEGRGDVG
jgi:hypothetical protein